MRPGPRRRGRRWPSRSEWLAFGVTFLLLGIVVAVASEWIAANTVMETVQQPGIVYTPYNLVTIPVIILLVVVILGYTQYLKT